MMRKISLSAALVGALLVVWWMGRPSSSPFSPPPEGKVSTPSQIASAPAALPSPEPKISRSPIQIKLRLAASAQPFLARLQQVPGIITAEFSATTSDLVVRQSYGAFTATSLAKFAEDSGVSVRGEVLDLPLVTDSHFSTCGSCGFILYQQLEKSPGVHAVEVFLPSRSQLRLLVAPDSQRAEDIAALLAAQKNQKTPHP